MKSKQIEKFWDILVAGNGSANHYDLGRGVFGGSWKKQWVEEIARVPVLAGLVTTARERVTLSGRIPLRYILTARGMELARTWKLLPAGGDLPPEELRRQFERLAATLNPWAEELQRMANFGRKKLEEVPPPEKKKRHRSERQLEKRRQWIANKELERLRAGTAPVAQPKPEADWQRWEPAKPVQPVQPSRVDPSVPVTSTGSHGGTGGFR